MFTRVASSALDGDRSIDHVESMSLDPTDEDSDQMEPLAEIRSAVREFDEDHITAPVTARERVPTDVCDGERHREKARSRRRRFLSTVVAVGVMAVGSAAGSWWSTRAAPNKGPKIVSAATSNYFAQLDRLQLVGGPAAIQSLYASANDSDVNKIIRWIGHRRDPAILPLLAACMSDPRTNTRWGAVNIAILIQPILLKPHLPAIQAAAIGETVPEIQSLFGQLIIALQNA